MKKYLKNSTFFKQAELVLRVLPLINRYTNFALKGGTALNFFYKDLPRLSVDIDLTYLKVEDRETTLRNITFILQDLSHDITKRIIHSKVVPQKLSKTNYIRTLIIAHNDVTIKIEPNFILRGSVFAPLNKSVSQRVEEIFEMSVECKNLSIEDLYGGKICAALDRQHPRDLFDIKLLFESGGITKKIKDAFIFYLLSCPRPIVELLNPNVIDIAHIFNNEFQGMTAIEVTLESLLQTRINLIKTINETFIEKDRKFILSFKEGNPNWELSEIENIQNYPSIKWKLANIQKMDKQKHERAITKLKEHLGM